MSTGAYCQSRSCFGTAIYESHRESDFSLQELQYCFAPEHKQLSNSQSRYCSVPETRWRRPYLGRGSRGNPRIKAKEAFRLRCMSGLHGLNSRACKCMTRRSAFRLIASGSLARDGSPVIHMARVWIKSLCMPALDAVCRISILPHSAFALHLRAWLLNCVPLFEKRYCQRCDHKEIATE